MNMDFAKGCQAFHDGKLASDNPHLDGFTKLGSPKYTNAEAGAEWYAGFLSAAPMRKATPAECAAALSVSVSQFRRKSNRYYRGGLS